GSDAVRLPEPPVNRLARRGLRALPNMHLARDANDAVELGSEQFAITVERIDVQRAQRRGSGFDSRHPAGGDPAQQSRQRLRPSRLRSGAMLLWSGNIRASSRISCTVPTSVFPAILASTIFRHFKTRMIAALPM